MPTWLLVRALSRFFPEGHPLKNNRLSYEEWLTSSTSLARDFDYALGISSALMISLVLAWLLFKL